MKIVYIVLLLNNFRLVISASETENWLNSLTTEIFDIEKPYHLTIFTYGESQGKNVIQSLSTNTPSIVIDLEEFKNDSSQDLS